MMSAEDSDTGRHENGHADDSGLQRAARVCQEPVLGVEIVRTSVMAAGKLLYLSERDQPCSYEPSNQEAGPARRVCACMEKLWVVLVAKIDGLEEAVTQILDNHRDALSQVWNHRQTGEELHTMWKDSRVLQELEGLLAAVDNASVRGAKRKRDRDEEDAVAQENSQSLEIS